MRVRGQKEESKMRWGNEEINQKETVMGELASFSSRLYFVAAGMSLQKHPDSSLCLHPETWSLSSGSHFQTHQTSLAAWPGFFWRCCREWTVPKRSIITLSLSFICWKCRCICNPGSHTPSLPLQSNARPCGVRDIGHCAELPALSTHQPMCWLTASNGL